MAECNTCGGYLSIEDKIRLSMKCDANGNVVWQGALLNQTYNPETDETVVFQSSVRTDIEIADVKEGDPAIIQLPYLHRETETSLVGRISDAGTLDIGSGNFAMCAWINDIEDDSYDRYILGKWNTTITNGCFTLLRRATTGFIAARFRTTEATIMITSAVVANLTGWHFVVFELDGTKGHLYIDNVEVGTGTAYTGSFPAVDELYKFNLGCANTNTGEPSNYFIGHLADIRVYHRLLTPTEKTTLYNHGNVTGATLHIPCTEANLHDISGNNLHPAIVGITSANIKYGDHGSRQGLEIGYDIYKSPGLPDIHIPLKSDGTSISSTTLAATYYKHSTVSGNALHNGFDSYILYAHDNFDRSDDTIYSDFARAANTKYIVATPKAWHITEHAILTFKLFANTGYKARTFPKWANGVLTEVISCNSDKTTISLRKALQYSNNYNSWHDLDYYVDDRNIVSTRLNYMLIYDVANGLLKMSIDNGLTYINQSALVAPGGITFAYIYENGDVLVANDTKLYYSHDLLATLTESTVLDENGDSFIAPEDCPFIRFQPDNYFKIGALEMPVWGNRSAGGNYGYNINCWYSSDGGITVKSFLHFDGDGTAASVQHIHAINFDGTYFWIQTGDGLSGNSTSRWYKAAYNIITDSWTVDLIHSGDNQTHFKTCGFGFANDDIYWSSDSVKLGIWKSKYSSIDDITKFEKVYKTDINGTITEIYALGLLSDGINMIVPISDHPELVISSDGGKSWESHSISGLPTLNEAPATARLLMIHPANSDGYHLIHMVEPEESMNNGTCALGKVLMLKITKP